MLVKKAYKFRIYPNKEQKIIIAKTIGCSRYVFNHFLGMWNDTYKDTGKGLTYNSCSSLLTQLKKELVWLREVDSISLQSSLKNLAGTYDRFFKKQNNVPRFKSKKNKVQSYTTKQTNGNIAIVESNCLLIIDLDGEFVKVHFHINAPWKSLEHCAWLGDIYDIAIEGVKRQAKALASRSGNTVN